jgi:hypothetical protein
MPGNVTSGNNVIIGINLFHNAGGTFNFITSDLTKSAGTATIGTIALDASLAAGASTIGTAIYRVPVTGTGSLTLLYTMTGQASNHSLQMGCAEFSGLNATPLDGAGSGSNSGTGTNHTTGSLTSTVPGMIYYAATELSDANFTRTISDTTVKNDQSGATLFTGLVQFKLISTTPNTLTDVTGADSVAWKVAYATYKTA